MTFRVLGGLRSIFWIGIVLGFFFFRAEFDMLAYDLFGDTYEQIGYYFAWLD